jgi:toxin ParE1/3/4
VRSYPVYFTSMAVRDLDNIWDYTQENWGTKQADAYLRDLKKSADSLGDMPLAGREYKASQAGIRLLAYKNHYWIAYRLNEQSVEILRVLHQASQWAKVLDV